jgi:hypothetical protein
VELTATASSGRGSSKWCVKVLGFGKPMYMFFKKDLLNLYTLMLHVDDITNFKDANVPLNVVQSFYRRRLLHYPPNSIPVYQKWRNNTRSWCAWKARGC